MIFCIPFGRWIELWQHSTATRSTIVCSTSWYIEAFGSSTETICDLECVVDVFNFVCDAPHSMGCWLYVNSHAGECLKHKWSWRVCSLSDRVDCVLIQTDKIYSSIVCVAYFCDNWIFLICRNRSTELWNEDVRVLGVERTSFLLLCCAETVFTCVICSFAFST